MFIRFFFFIIFCTVHTLFSMERLIQNMPQQELDLRLLLVAEEGDQRQLELLLEYEASINTQDRFDGINDQEDTPLIRAARAGHAGIVQLLLNEGARLNIQNASGHTALYYAVKSGQLGMVEKCIERGADIFIASDEGTAIEYAAQSGTQSMLNLLLTGISHDDEYYILDHQEQLLCVNREFQQAKKARELIANHLVANLVQERMDRIADFLAPGAPAYEPIRACIERKIKCILFGDPVPKKLPEYTREEFDPFGSW